MQPTLDAEIRTEENWSFYYNETPGHAPAGSRDIPVGAEVEVAPSGFIGRPTWTGVVQGHMHTKSDDRYMGLSVVTCTDPRGFANHFAGQGCQAEIRHMSLIGAYSSSGSGSGSAT